MTADPKKDNEIKDEDLNQVAGGTGSDVDDERPDDYDGGGTTPSTPTGGKLKTEKI